LSDENTQVAGTATAPPIAHTLAMPDAFTLVFVALGALLIGIFVIPLIKGFRDRFASARPAIASSKAHRILFLLLSSALLLLSSHFLFPNGMMHILFHEVGFALLVSVVVWSLFEAQLSHEAEATWDERIKRVSQNVFHAVLGKELPKPLIDEAQTLILNSNLIRRDFAVTYTLRDGTFAQTADENVDCVLISAVMNFSMENISATEVPWSPGIGLPNPIHPALKEQVQVLKFAVSKGGKPVALDLEKAEQTFRERLRDDANTHVSYGAGIVTLQPKEICFFTAEYVMAKEPEDSEFLQTVVPSDGLRLTVFDQADDGRRVIFADGVHRRPLERSGVETETGAKIFTIPGYLLPHRGVLIWWKKNPIRG
jgi:hypothetical protein